MSSLTSSYAGALILASMAALGAAYLGNTVPGESKPAEISPLVTPPAPEAPSVPEVPPAPEAPSVPEVPPAPEAPSVPEVPPAPSGLPSAPEVPPERPTLSDEEARRKLKCVVSDAAIDAMFKFVKTPVKDWAQIGPTTTRLSALVAKTMTHPDRCPAVMARICALVFNKYSQMVKAIRDPNPEGYDNVGSVWFEFSELVDELPDCDTQTVSVPEIQSQQSQTSIAPLALPAPAPEPEAPLALPAPAPEPEVPPAPIQEPVVSVPEPAPTIGAPQPDAEAPALPGTVQEQNPALDQLFPFRRLQKPGPAVDQSLLKQAEEAAATAPINADIYREPGVDAPVSAPSPKQPAGQGFNPLKFAEQAKTYIESLKSSGTPDSEIRKAQDSLVKQYEKELRAAASRGLLSGTMANAFIGETRKKICGGRRTTARQDHM